MRAREFIVEYKEYPTREYEGVTFTMKEKDGQLIVKPLNDYGISMGHVVFNMDGKILDPQDLVIADKYQGQGIAKVMYDYIKSLGFTIERSWDQTDAGKGFWDKHRGEDVRVWEDVPQPGPSSGAPKQFGPDAEIQTRQMTVKDIISSVPGLPYYNNVVDDWDAKDYSWGVTKKVIEYAQYLKQHPESLANLPPILVLNGKFEDGAHRISAIWLLQQRMDPKNPLWKNAKLNVQFVKQGLVQEQSEESMSTVVYHGNQGGIHRELITPMWWTESKEDAISYATQGGADGWVYSAKLSCKNPYVIKPTDETNTVLEKYKQLQKQGYDSIYDESVGDWIPFYSKDIHLVGKPEYFDPEEY